MKTAIIYARQKQFATNNTIENQFAICKKFALEQNIKIVCQYKDTIFPNKTQLDGLTKLLKDAENSNWNYIIIDQFKELGRKLTEVNKILKHLSTNKKVLLVAEFKNGDYRL